MGDNHGRRLAEDRDPSQPDQRVYSKTARPVAEILIVESVQSVFATYALGAAAAAMNLLIGVYAPQGGLFNIPLVAVAIDQAQAPSQVRTSAMTPDCSVAATSPFALGRA